MLRFFTITVLLRLMVFVFFCTSVSKGFAVFERVLNPLLSAAVVHGNFPITRLLLQLGSNIDSYDEHGYPPIYWAVKQGNSSMLRFLLDHHSNWTLLCGQQTLLEVALNVHLKNRNQIVAILISVLVAKLDNKDFWVGDEKRIFLNSILGVLDNPLYEIALAEGLTIINEIRQSLNRILVTIENLKSGINKIDCPIRINIKRCELGK